MSFKWFPYSLRNSAAIQCRSSKTLLYTSKVIPSLWPEMWVILYPEIWNIESSDEFKKKISSDNYQCQLSKMWTKTWVFSKHIVNICYLPCLKRMKYKCSLSINKPNITKKIYISTIFLLFYCLHTSPISILV